MKKLQLFDTNKKPKVTPNRLAERLGYLQEAACFKADTEEKIKARYALYKNISEYKRAIDIFTDMLEKMPEKLNEFNQKRYELAMKCGGTSEQLPDGSSHVTGIKDKDKFESGLIKLKLQYKDVIEESKQIMKRNEELYNTDIDDVPEPYKVNSSYFPSCVDASKLSNISFMLIDDDNQNIKNGENGQI
jgi:hypothetical protein